MCGDCWDQAGKPDHTSPEIERAVELIGRLYQFASTGGPLHVATDDWNLEDKSLTFCAIEAARWTREEENERRPTPTPDLDEYGDPGDFPLTPEQFSEAKTVAQGLAALLLSMPELDRHAALAHAEGFTGREPNH